MGPKTSLPVLERSVIHPLTVSLVVALQVQLDGHIQLVVAGSSAGIGAVHEVLYTVIREGDVGQRCGRALELPGQMVPFEGRRHLARDTRREPVTLLVAPNVPVAAADVALRAKNP